MGSTPHGVGAVIAVYWSKWMPCRATRINPIPFSFRKTPFNPSSGSAAPTSARKHPGWPRKMEGSPRGLQTVTGCLNGRPPDRSGHRAFCIYQRTYHAIHCPAPRGFGKLLSLDCSTQATYNFHQLRARGLHNHPYESDRTYRRAGAVVRWWRFLLRRCGLRWRRNRHCFSPAPRPPTPRYHLSC